MTPQILVVDDDPTARIVVQAALTVAGYQVTTATSGREALQLVEQVQPDLVVLDVMMPDLSGYEVCRYLRQNPATSNLPVLMLTALDSLDEKIKGFEAGADDFLPKPFDADELSARVKVLLRRARPMSAKSFQVQGKVIGVFSLRGGVGVSSLAANLAIGLARLWEEPAVLVDLALMNGQSALMLNLSLRNTWADFGHMLLDEIDFEVVDMVLLTHETGVRLLAAPQRLEEMETVSPEKVAHILQILKEKFAYVVLDMPHDFQETTLVGFDAADEVLAVMAPELASVRSMFMTLDVLGKLEYPDDATRVVLNWTFPRKGLARKDVERVLRRKVGVVLPYAPDSLVMGINLGTPTILNEPNSPMGRVLEDFAFLVSREEHRAKKPRKPTETWQRVQARRKKRLQTHKGV